MDDEVRIKDTPSYYQTSEGLRIYYHKQVPANARGLILISHGFGEYYGLYTDFIDFLSQNSYGVCAYDHRAHGYSETERGHIERFECFIEDMEEVISHLKQEHPALPLFVFGHSMGGLVAFNYGILYPDRIEGQIFSGPAVCRAAGTEHIPKFVFLLFKRYFPRVKLYTSFARKGTRNKDFLAQHRHDPLILKYETLGFISEFLHRGVAFAQENAPRYHLPALFLHGKADKIIPCRASVELYEKISSQDKTLKLYDHLYHELVREPEKEEVWQDILTWLEKRAPYTDLPLLSRE